MRAKDRIQSFLDAYSKGVTSDGYYDGACHGLRIALASLEMEDNEHGQVRESNREGNLWDSKHRHKTALRSDAERTERRTSPLG